MNLQEALEQAQFLENQGSHGFVEFIQKQQTELEKLKNLLLDNQILLDKTLNAWAKEMERKK